MDAIKTTYSQKGLTEKVHAPIVNTQGQAFANGINGIYGDVDFDTPDYYMREVLKRNTWQFSVAKNYNEQIRLNNLLLNEDGSLRPWSDFKYEAQKVVGDSIRYLKTEYDTIVAGAQMSRIWAEIQRDKHIFPYVQLIVVQDGRTSDICEPLHNLIFEVDDPVLMYFFPPNHFNCRTTVKKLRRGVPSSKYELPNIPEAFRNNVGATGEVFTKENTYIKNAPTKLLSDLDYYEKDGIEISTKAEKWSSSNKERERQKIEFQQRIDAAKAMKDYFEQKVKILPEILPNHWSYNYHFENAPIRNKVTDIKVGKTFWEMESYEGKFRIGKISSMIKHGQQQANHVILKLNHNIPKSKVQEQINELIKKEIVTAHRVIVVYGQQVILDIEVKKSRI